MQIHHALQKDRLYLNICEAGVHVLVLVLPNDDERYHQDIGRKGVCSMTPVKCLNIGDVFKPIFLNHRI